MRRKGRKHGTKDRKVNKGENGEKEEAGPENDTEGSPQSLTSIIIINTRWSSI